MVTANAAGFYGFDVTRLTPLGDELGPLVAEVARPITPDEYPRASTCNAFDPAPTARAW
jgi:hypothetical protein